MSSVTGSIQCYDIVGNFTSIGQQHITHITHIVWLFDVWDGSWWHVLCWFDQKFRNVRNRLIYIVMSFRQLQVSPNSEWNTMYNRRCGLWHERMQCHCMFQKICLEDTDSGVFAMHAFQLNDGTWWIMEEICAIKALLGSVYIFVSFYDNSYY